jgi:hypothetical protein
VENWKWRIKWVEEKCMYEAAVGTGKGSREWCGSIWEWRRGEVRVGGY